jgi:ADP-ribose pyrophosphatase YjhB (NUDIX family)
LGHRDKEVGLIGERASDLSAAIRVAIRNEVASIQPFDESEGIHQADALAWIDSGAPLCRTAKPAIPPKHLVSYFAVVDGRNILLVDHKSAQLWLPPGGHVEPGEHPRDTVVRELFEELRIVPGHEIAAPLMITCTTTVGLTAGHVDVSLWYVVTVDGYQSMQFDEQEFSGVRWFGYSDVPLVRSDPHLARFLAKLASSPRFERV